MKFNLLFFVITVCMGAFVHSQTPASKYYKQINLAEQTLIEGNLQSSVSIYKNAFEKFNYPFSKHIQQGYFVACYAKNKEVAELFLSKSIMNGMTDEQLSYYKDLWGITNSDSKLDLDFDSLRCESLKRLDTSLLFKYLEIDAYREVVLDNLNYKDSLSLVNYHHEMNVLRDEYIQLVESSGYPAERLVGTAWKWKLLKRMKKKYRSSLTHKLPVDKWGATKYKFIVVKRHRQTVSFKPGNWFLTHHINTDDFSAIDSILFPTLKLGFDSLKIDPLIMVNALESTREPNNEFALSYYSRLWVYKLNSSYVEKFAIKGKQRSTINANRASYHIRSLEQEEQLFRALYKLKYSERISGEITEKHTDDLAAEVTLFLNIYA